MPAYTCPRYEVVIYLGARRGYDGPEFSEGELMAGIARFQRSKAGEPWVGVRITPTRYVMQDYQESGWEIAAVNYPREAKAESEIDNFMLRLAEHLMAAFDQERLNVAFPDRMLTLEK